MAFYYVKSAGTATGDGGRYASAQTGSFAGLGASGYYANIVAAFGATTAPAAGDSIYVSDASAHTYSGTASLTALPTGASAPVNIISVSDTAIDSYSKATSAQEIAPSGEDFAFQTTGGRAALRGMYIQAGDDIQFGSEKSVIIFDECTLETTGPNDKAIGLEQDGSRAELMNCTLACNGSTSALPIYMIRGTEIIMFACSVTTDQSGINNLIDSSTPDSATANITGCDLSEITGALVSIGGTGAGVMNIRFDRCQLNASLTSYVDTTLTRNQTVEVYNCGSGAGVDYQFYKNTGNSTAEDDTTFYRDDTTAFTEQGQEVSIKVVTASTVSAFNGFWFDLPARYAELSSASTDTLRLYLLSSDSGLTDNDVWVGLIYPDGTNKHVPNFLTTQNTDPIASGTALDSNTDAWTGRTSETRYQIDVDTSSDAGADCVPIIRVYIGKASTTIYFDTTVDVVA